jgi:uncharacterized membrane-anchored protein
MHLVENWKEAWKWFSVQAITAALVWEMLPLETRALLPDAIEPHVSAIFLVIAAIGRVIDQQGKTTDVDTE